MNVTIFPMPRYPIRYPYQWVLPNSFLASLLPARVLTAAETLNLFILPQIFQNTANQVYTYARTFTLNISHTESINGFSYHIHNNLVSSF